MVTRPEGAGLSAECPKCGDTVYAGSLRELGTRLKNHCRKRKPPPPVAVGVLPELPALFVFNCKLESQNRTTYSHWSVYNQYKKSWQKRVQQQMAAVFGLRLPYSRWRLTRWYVRANHIMDYGNLVGGAKPLIDCLITYGVIKDDNPNCFDCAYEQQQGDTARLTLELLEASCQQSDPQPSKTS